MDAGPLEIGFNRRDHAVGEVVPGPQEQVPRVSAHVVADDAAVIGISARVYRMPVPERAVAAVPRGICPFEPYIKVVNPERPVSQQAVDVRPASWRLGRPWGVP